MNILLGQLAANGDCLYATILARQIRQDNPRCNLVWAVSSACASMVENNPDIDACWQLPLPDGQEAGWYWFQHEAQRMLENGEFDRVVLSQVWPANFQRFDGTVRPSLLRAYGAAITVPIQPVLSLTEAEIAAVEAFVRSTGVADRTHRILFECASNSGQSDVTPAFAVRVAELVLARLPDAAFVLSSAHAVASDDARIVSAHTISLRQNAALSRHCSLLVGCASGVTVATTSTSGAPLPMIQLLKGGRSVYASFEHDHRHWGLPTDGIVEMLDASPEQAAQCILDACRGGIAAAKQQHHMQIPLDFAFYWKLINGSLMKKGRYIDAAASLTATAERYGWLPELLALARKKVAWMLPHDARYAFPNRRRDVDQFLETIHSVSP
jgi:hypothetical protein